MSLTENTTGVGCSLLVDHVGNRLIPFKYVEGLNSCGAELINLTYFAVKMGRSVLG